MSHSNSLNIKHVWLAKFVLILKIIVGISLLALSAWITLYSNSTPMTQNPAYSGLIIIISGLLGLYLISFKRSRSKFKMNFFWFLKVSGARKCSDVNDVK
jgi:FtsH-binding integral membrane protein